MSTPVEEPDDANIDRRAELLPEERAVGSDDPEREAAVILEDSEARTEDPEGTKESSTQTPD